MSGKSKKYRRTNIAAASYDNAPVDTANNIAAAKPAAKNAASAIPVPTAKSLARDLTWTGITTLIVVILMVVAYYVVPR